MVRNLMIVAAGLACLGFSTSAKADVLVPTSTFDVVIGTYDNTSAMYTYSQKYTVGANSSTGVTYNGVRSTISEAETLLSTGQTKIAVVFDASAELFPEVGSTDPLAAFFSVGAYGDPMDFTSTVNLGSALLLITDQSGLNTFDVLSDISHSAPFNGIFTDVMKGELINGVQNDGVNRIELDLTTAAAATTAQTPEPSSLALLGSGLVGVLAMARRRFLA